MKSTCCRPKSPVRKKIDRLTGLIRAVDEPNRLKILCLLKNGERCVCEIFKPLNLPQNLVSHHLKTLRDAGLIGFRKAGQKAVYFRNERNIKRFENLFHAIINL